MEPELRDWYLASLGIVQYRLRSLDSTAVAANAASGHRQTEQRIMEAPDGGVAEAQVAAMAASGLPAAKERPPHSVKLTNEDPQPVTTTSDGNNGQRPDAIPEESVTFRLACWRPSEDLLVIDSWPPGRGQDPQLLQLLMNILRAVQRLPESLNPAEFIDWPIPGDRLMPDTRGVAEARDHVAMFLQGRYEQQPFKWLLAMGVDIRRYLETPHLSREPDEVSQHLGCGAEVIFTHSLSNMISSPQCKKDVWAAIRFLSRR